jgi:hypothetical protein
MGTTCDKNTSLIAIRLRNCILFLTVEMLNVVTHLYAFSEDPPATVEEREDTTDSERISELPQADEVLLCTESTTFEQVWSLAFFGFFCLSLFFSFNCYPRIFRVHEKLVPTLRQGGG